MQIWAKVVATIGSTLFALIGMIMLVNETVAGLVVIIVGILVSIVSSWTLYGFGIIVESQEKSKKDIETISLNVRDIARCMAKELKEAQVVEEKEENAS